MCVIVVKPSNVAFPSWDTLQQCFNANPDGSGFMYNTRDGKVRIEKGFMTWKDFKAALKKAKKSMPENAACVMHFRIMTHGEVSRECCHPFPVTNNLNYIRKTEVTVPYGVAHNGIFIGRDTSPLKSDTMDYVMKVVYPLYKLCPKDLATSQYVENILEETADGCRICVMDGNGEMQIIGKWEIDDGVLYSNNNFRRKAWHGWEDYGYGSGYKSYGKPYGGIKVTKSKSVKSTSTQPLLDSPYDDGYWCENCTAFDACADSGHFVCFEGDPYYSTLY